MFTTILTNLVTALQAITAFCNAAKSLFDVAPELLPILTQRQLNELHAKIIALESAANPDSRDLLGRLRLEEAGVRKCHEALLARLAASASGKASASK